MQAVRLKRGRDDTPLGESAELTGRMEQRNMQCNCKCYWYGWSIPISLARPRSHSGSLALAKARSREKETVFGWLAGRRKRNQTVGNRKLQSNHPNPVGRPFLPVRYRSAWLEISFLEISPNPNRISHLLCCAVFFFLFEISAVLCW